MKKELAVKMRKQGRSLRYIQKKLGYKSVYSVQNLLREESRIEKIEKTILYLADMMENPNHDQYKIWQTAQEILNPNKPKQ